MARPIQGQVLRYVPGQVPDNAADIPRFLREELEQIRQSISLVQDGQLDVTTVAPSKPRDGMLRRADGTGWNPGSGQGVYCFYNAAWRFLG
jgi:hypothetical protein